jgi:DNA ligase-1
MKKFETPPLYSLDAHGQVRQWDISVMAQKDGSAIITRVHGLQNGKRQINNKAISEGKNIGRSNETTPFEQAVSEAESMWKKALDKGFQETIPDFSEPAKIWLPMKAQSWHKQSHKIIYPAYIQPKFNGVRSLVEAKEEEIIYHSSRNKTYTTINHLDSYIREYFNKDIIPDGEIYVHLWPLNKIVSSVKKCHPETRQLQFWIFDLAITDKMFEHRWAWIDEHIPKHHPFIKKAPTFLVKNKEDVERYYEKFISAGYEGAMIRNAHGMYRFKYRSADILKKPEYLREEFLIVGGKEGTGLDKGCVIFMCKAKNEKEFEVRPQGSVELRREYFKNLKKYIGKNLTVKYKELTAYGIPHCGVGESIRDYE